MYLNKLNIEEKEAFLKLAHIVAGANSVEEEAEKNMIAQYCIEMKIEDTLFESVSIEKILSEFDNSSIVVKKIVLIELIGLCMSDGEFDSVEKEIIKNISSNFGISKEKLNDLENDLDDYFEIVTMMTKHIFS